MHSPGVEPTVIHVLRDGEKQGKKHNNKNVASNIGNNSLVNEYFPPDNKLLHEILYKLFFLNKAGADEHNNQQSEQSFCTHGRTKGYNHKICDKINYPNNIFMTYQMPSRGSSCLDFNCNTETITRKQ